MRPGASLTSRTRRWCGRLIRQRGRRKQARRKTAGRSSAAGLPEWHRPSTECSERKPSGCRRDDRFRRCRSSGVLTRASLVAELSDETKPAVPAPPAAVVAPPAAPLVAPLPPDALPLPASPAVTAESVFCSGLMPPPAAGVDHHGSGLSGGEDVAHLLCDVMQRCCGGSSVGSGWSVV